MVIPVTLHEFVLIIFTVFILALLVLVIVHDAAAIGNMRQVMNELVQVVSEGDSEFELEIALVSVLAMVMDDSFVRLFVAVVVIVLVEMAVSVGMEHELVMDEHTGFDFPTFLADSLGQISSQFAHLFQYFHLDKH